MVSACSSSKDRLLTKILIENSNKSLSKCVHHFVNKSEWVDGLDIWSLKDLIRKNDIYKGYLDFHEEIGIYLPKSNKSNSISIERTCQYSEDLKQLFENEQIHLNHSSISEENTTKNFIPKRSANENSSNKVRFPLRQVESKNCSRENKSKEMPERINDDQLECSLKEQLSNIFSREISNLTSKRTAIRIPSVQIKHQNFPRRTNSQTDPTEIMERYKKVHQLLISPLPTQPTIIKTFSEQQQSPFVFQRISSLALNGTPMDFCSSKHLQNSSADQTSEQQNALITIRPSTQSVFRSSSVEQNEEQQTMFSKRHCQTTSISSSANSSISNTNSNSTDEQTQRIRKYPRFHRSLPRNTIPRARTLQLLPYISGKSIHVTFSNQRNSSS